MRSDLLILVCVFCSFIYLNAVRGLSSLTDVHGEKIMKKLMGIYSNPKEMMDSRLHIGEAILQTIQRCGDALGKYSELPHILVSSVHASWEVVIILRNCIIGD